MPLLEIPARWESFWVLPRSWLGGNSFRFGQDPAFPAFHPHRHHNFETIQYLLVRFSLFGPSALQEYGPRRHQWIRTCVTFLFGTARLAAAQWAAPVLRIVWFFYCGESYSLHEPQANESALPRRSFGFRWRAHK